MSRPIYTCLGSYVELGLTRSDVLACSHSGPCDTDVAEVLRKPYIRRQFASMDPADIRLELKEYGCWDAEELADEEQNRARVVWLAANDIAEAAPC